MIFRCNPHPCAHRRALHGFPNPVSLPYSLLLALLNRPLYPPCGASWASCPAIQDLDNLCINSVTREGTKDADLGKVGRVATWRTWSSNRESW